jgi:hypothetical protein
VRRRPEELQRQDGTFFLPLVDIPYFSGVDFGGGGGGG